MAVLPAVEIIIMDVDAEAGCGFWFCYSSVTETAVLAADVAVTIATTIIIAVNGWFFLSFFLVAAETITLGDAANFPI